MPNAEDTRRKRLEQSGDAITLSNAERRRDIVGKTSRGSFGAATVAEGERR